jgi:hypothetical protein
VAAAALAKASPEFHYINNQTVRADEDETRVRMQKSECISSYHFINKSKDAMKWNKAQYAPFELRRYMSDLDRAR